MSLLKLMPAINSPMFLLGIDPGGTFRGNVRGTPICLFF